MIQHAALERSLKGQLITVFGSGGFLDRYVAEQIILAGGRLRIAGRRVDLAYSIRQLAPLGDVQFVSADLTLPETVRTVVIGADVVINLNAVSRDAAVKRRAHVDGARTVAEAAHAAGCRALVHMSGLGADAATGGVYGKTMGDGEAAVRSAFPMATVLRSSLLFGPEDDFINRFARMAQGIRTVPVIAAKRRFQPVYVGDVAKAIAHVAASPAEYGARLFELGGPEVATMTSILHWIARQTGLRPWPVRLPDAIAGIMARMADWLPGAPLTYAQYLILQQDNVVTPGAQGLTELGIAPTPIAAVAENWMVRFRPHGRFGRRLASA